MRRYHRPFARHEFPEQHAECFRCQLQIDLRKRPSHLNMPTDPKLPDAFSSRSHNNSRDLSSILWEPGICACDEGTPSQLRGAALITQYLRGAWPRGEVFAAWPQSLSACHEAKPQLGNLGILFCRRFAWPHGSLCTVAPPCGLLIQFIDLILNSLVAPVSFTISLDQDAGYPSSTEAMMHMYFDVPNLEW